jgi:hypothetical protein
MLDCLGNVAVVQPVRSRYFDDEFIDDADHAAHALGCGLRLPTLDEVRYRSSQGNDSVARGDADVVGRDLRIEGEFFDDAFLKFDGGHSNHIVWLCWERDAKGVLQSFLRWRYAGCMSEVRLAERRVELPVNPAFAALGEILASISRQEGPWAGFAFHVALGDCSLPDVGYVSIPILLSVEPAPSGVNEYFVTIRASRHADAFPVLSGALGVDMSSRTTSTLWIGGKYDVPMGSLGSLMDLSVARGIAQRTLENFLDDIARACVARVEQRESDYMRYAHHQHA